jgi:hypothetical protein
MNTEFRNIVIQLERMVSENIELREVLRRIAGWDPTHPNFANLAIAEANRAIAKAEGT